MEGKTDRPRTYTGRITGSVAFRLTLLLIASALSHAQSVGQVTNQFGARPTAAAKAVEIEQITTASAVPIPGLPKGERLGANASTEAIAVEPSTEVGASSTPRPQFRI